MKQACIFLFLFLTSVLSAQKTHTFNSGLVLPASHRYGREALFSDQLAYRLNNGTLSTPAAGQTVFTDEKGQEVNWQALEANAENKFKGFPLANGYLYLTYRSNKGKKALLNITNNSMVYVNGEPRGGDLYGSGNMMLPIRLKKGLNEFYIRGGRFSAWSGITAQLIFNKQPVILNVDDPTLPITVAGDDNSRVWAAVIVINTNKKRLKNLSIKSAAGGKEILSGIPEVPALSIRKVGFILDASALTSKGKHPCKLTLLQGKNTLDQKEVQLETVLPGEDYSETFVSKIDGSIQYYSVSPQEAGGKTPPALYLSVHGAGVEAINQARAYQSKEEGPVVCPTNRRPRGFNWEDWGRIDAMEVLNIAKWKFKPDPARIYLTGHSMGGHGTWFLGATYAGRWAAIAPCAGYPTMSTYGSADGLVPTAGKSAVEDLLIRASNPGNVFELVQNYNAGGVYIFHGDSDRTVSVEYARDMRRRLAESTKDLSYYEYPGGSHWFGDQSVDWKPIFDYFGWHTIPADTLVQEINFTTANPAVSSEHFWTSVLQQEESMKFSRLKVRRSDDYQNITGTTENISLLSFSLSRKKRNNTVRITLDGKQELSRDDTVRITLDGQPELNYVVRKSNDKVYLRKVNNSWQLSDPEIPGEKGAVRNGTFKEPFNHRMVFVYGTSGNKEENEWAFNKARYDAENWYYRGNGNVSMIPDKEFSLQNYLNRGVVLYGNASTNRAWELLLSDCPVQVSKTAITVGSKTYTGENLAAYFMWPRADSRIAGVAVVAGTGIEGMRAADANQYFSGGSGFPDYMVFSSGLLINGSSEIKDAGFYDNKWRVKN